MGSWWMWSQRARYGLDIMLPLKPATRLDIQLQALLSGLEVVAVVQQSQDRSSQLGKGLDRREANLQPSPPSPLLSLLCHHSLLPFHPRLAYPCHRHRLPPSQFASQSRGLSLPLVVSLSRNPPPRRPVPPSTLIKRRLQCWPPRGLQLGPSHLFASNWKSPWQAHITRDWRDDTAGG